MKVFGIFLLSFYLASARIAEPRSDVNKDLQDLINLIPRADIENIVKKWVSTDDECKKDWEYATSAAFHELVKNVEQSPEFLAIRQKLEGVHVNVPLFVNMVHEIIGMEPISRKWSVDIGGLRGALDEIRPKIPMAKIKLKVAEKWMFSSQFRALANLLKSADFKILVKALQATAPAVAAINDAQANGVDMKAIYDFMAGLKYLLKVGDVENVYYY